MTAIKKKIAVLGSTGSIGCSAEAALREDGAGFEVVALAAGAGSDKLAEQVREFSPRIVAVRDEAEALSLKNKLNGVDVEIVHGPEGLVKATVESGADMALNALCGSAGIRPSFECVNAGISLLLANKEAIVAAGEIITATARRTGAEIIPVDSEHSAIFQCLLGESHESVRKLIITASGGPFFKNNFAGEITPEMALKHPTWKMGPKVTIDSATLFNKGLEIIEAMWFFDMPLEKIKVVIHPESVIHSMVEFSDGSTKAQMSHPDMKGPIRYAMHYPRRADSQLAGGMDFSKAGTLSFFEPELSKYPCLELAMAAASEMGLLPAMLSAADEVAVDAFLKRRIKFDDIPRVIDKVLNEGRGKIIVGEKATLEAALEMDAEARRIAEDYVRVAC